MQSSLGYILVFIVIPQLVSATRNEELKREVEEEFIKKYYYVDTDMILRTNLRNLKAEDRAYLCYKILPDNREYTLDDFPLLVTRQVEFRRKRNPILMEMLNCTKDIAIFEGVDDKCFYLLKRKTKGRLQITKETQYRISSSHCYDANAMKAAQFTLPPTVRIHESGIGSTSYRYEKTYNSQDEESNGNTPSPNTREVRRPYTFAKIGLERTKS